MFDGRHAVRVADTAAGCTIQTSIAEIPPLLQPVLSDWDSEKGFNERRNQTQLFEVRSQVRGSSGRLSCPGYLLL